MRYVDGYVIPIPKNQVEAYARIARKAGKIWMEHGALAYTECLGDDLGVKGMTPFPKGIKAKPGETIAFSWVIFKSKAHRDKVNAAVMQDPRIMRMGEASSPMDCRRMLYGGFKTLVDL